MHHSRLLVILLGLLCLPSAWAQTRVPEPDRPTVGWNRSPGAVVFQVRTRIGMIAEDEKGPVITVYGDGTVEAYYPFYMQRAGLWRARLDDADLQQLVDVAVRARLFDVDSTELARSLREASTDKQRDEGSLSVRSDSEWTELLMRLRMTSGNQQTPLENVIRVRDLPWNARRLPELSELTGVADFVERIESLSRSSGLREVKP